MAELGPHLLGRRYVPDDRDWTPRQLHELSQPDEALLDMTVREAINTSPFFRSWSGILALWRWIKLHLKPVPSPAPAPAPATREWADPIVLDQGEYGTCVGNGWAGWGDSEPVMDTFDETAARAIYYEATVIDGTPDDPNAAGGGQMGSTVRSGAKAMQNRKRLAAYAFAKNLSEIDEWLSNHGPVVMGTDWTSDMFNPDAKGLIRVTGAVEGGHCWLLRFKDPLTGNYRARNSWGSGWGDGGDFEISSDDLLKLLIGIDSPGEACLALEVPLGA